MTAMDGTISSPMKYRVPIPNEARMRRMIREEHRARYEYEMTAFDYDNFVGYAFEYCRSLMGKMGWWAPRRGSCADEWLFKVGIIRFILTDVARDGDIWNKACTKKVLKDVEMCIDDLHSLEGCEFEWQQASNLLNDATDVMPKKKMKRLQTLLSRTQLQQLRERRKRERRLQESGFSGDDLPEEIVEEIIEKAISEDPLEALKCALVSKTWNRVVRRLVQRGATTRRSVSETICADADSDGQRRMHVFRELGGMTTSRILQGLEPKPGIVSAPEYPKYRDDFRFSILKSPDLGVLSDYEAGLRRIVFWMALNTVLLEARERFEMESSDLSSDESEDNVDYFVR